MADYYPLIARAVAGLDPSAPGEARRALYERARSALIQQLRSVQPPLTESEITRERLSLEEAVRKVESEAAQRAREASRGAAARSRAGDAFRSSSRAAAGRPPGSAPEDDGGQPEAGQRPAPPPARPPRRTPPSRPPGPPEPVVRERPPGRRGYDDESAAASYGHPDAEPPQSGIRGFRDVVADADDLGRAAAQANRSARRTYANVPSPTPEFERLEPDLENRADLHEPYPDDLAGDDSGYDEPPATPRSRRGGAARVPGRPRTGGGFPFKSAIAIGVILILAGAAILWGPAAVSMVRGLLKPNANIASRTAVESPKNGPAQQPKITDRVGQPSTDQVAPVAQRVVLYDEDPSDPKGKQYVGTVVWRTEQVKGSAGQPADIAVRADIDIPERKFKMTMSFRRNTDTSLPASHTAELTFILPPDFDGGGVANVPGILMKSNEQARGTPLAGLAVKVTDGFFLVGLSNVEADRVRNLQLLKERSWFDIPLVYTNQRRAIIAIEKGPPGERAFNEAFAAWGE